MRNWVVAKRVKVVEVTSSCRIEGRREEGESSRSQFFFVVKEKQSVARQKFRIITKLGLASQRALEKLESFQ